MAVPFPYPENINNFMDLIRHVSTITNNFFGVAILLAIGVVSFIATKEYTFEKSLGYSAFFVFLSALLLRFMQLISYETFYFCVAIFVGVAIFLFVKREG